MVDEFVNLKNLTKKNYSDYFLQINPFPTSAVPDESPPFTADREKEKSHFRDVLGELINNQKSSATVFVGEYGSGKSHLMRALKHSVNKQLFSFDDGTLAIYVRTTGRNFLDFYTELIEDVQKDNLKAFAEKLISDFIKKHRKNIGKLIYDPQLKKEIDKVENDIPKFLESSMTVDFFKEIDNSDFINLRNRDVLHAFLNLAHPTYSTYAWSWFIGSKLSKDERELIQVRDTIDDPRSAYLIFGDFIKLLNAVGIKNIVLFIDELEKLTTISSNLRSIYQDDLRHLIDDYPHELAIFLAIAGFQWKDLLKERTALVRRIENNVFNIEFFNLDQVKELIAMYLGHARTEKFDNKIKKIQDCEASLYPFTNESLDEIYALTNGVCSRIIALCRRCIEYVADKNKGEVITAEIVKKLQSST